MSKVSMFVKFTTQPGRRQDLVDAFADIRPLVDAEEGTEIYSLHLDQAAEDVAWLIELYTDQAALDAHAGGPVIAALLPRFEGLLAEAPDLRLTMPAGGKGIEL